MNRVQALALVLALFLVGGLVAWLRLPPAQVAPTCPDGGVRTTGPDGVTRCGPGEPLRAGAAMAVGQKFDCNQATAAELAQVDGIGLALAEQLVAARDAGFTSWDEIDALPGVGPARLSALQAACDIRVSDAGVW